MRRPSVAYLGLVLVPLVVAGAAQRREVPGGRTRIYYVAADEVVWDYAPSGTNLISGQPFDAVERPFVVAGPHSVGKVTLKALYREYTDSTFSTPKPRPAELAYLGFLGPLLRAEVGDTIRVVFKNNTRFPASMHPHGVSYTKSSEGAPYVGGAGTSADVPGGAVAPGAVHTYVWPVPERAGPGPGDGSSVLWMYHSHVHEEQDVSSGLMGPMIVTARGMARPDGSPKDVDHEVVMAFYEVDENSSRFLSHNSRAYMTQPDSVHVDTVFALPVVRIDGQYNFKETMNGFMYGNGPLPTMRVGERVRWYLMATTGFEIHAPHWHGNTVVINHMRTDVTALLPMGMAVADMVPDNPGVWLFHCHVSNHLRMGMQSRYEVLAR
jgi:FtsP/CotA-like multicopper oxidase with cupredoxin domain